MQAVGKYHDAGFQQIKIYSLVTPPIVEAICAEAHRLGMTVTGHIPNRMTIEQAVAGARFLSSGGAEGESSGKWPFATPRSTASAWQSDEIFTAATPATE